MVCRVTCWRFRSKTPWKVQVAPPAATKVGEAHTSETLNRNTSTGKTAKRSHKRKSPEPPSFQGRYRSTRAVWLKRFRRRLQCSKWRAQQGKARQHNGVASRNRWAASPVESRRVARSSDGTESPGANDPAPSPLRESEAADCVGAAVAYPAGRAPGLISNAVTAQAFEPLRCVSDAECPLCSILMDMTFST